MITCYESRKAEQGYPVCCENKDCDKERRTKLILACEMILSSGVWVDNAACNAEGKFGFSLYPMLENMKVFEGVV